MKRILAPYNGRISEKSRYLLISVLDYSTDIVGNTICNPKWKLLLKAVHLCKSTMLFYKYSPKRRYHCSAMHSRLLKSISHEH